MSNNSSGNDWPTGGHEHERAPRSRPHSGSGFGQPASDSQQLREFGSRYEEHLRHTRPLSAYPEHELRSQESSGPLLLGLALFLLLLVIAMGLAVLLIHPR